MTQALLIFARNPEAGKVKTRLAATIGIEAALAVYKQLLNRTVVVTESLPVDKFVFYAGHVTRTDIWPGDKYCKELQLGADLGEKMSHAFQSVFERGYDQVAIIGTDCPQLDALVLRDAFDSLSSHDIVIGPAEDGGYYLLGMKQLHKWLFENVRWGTESVLDQTVLKLKQRNLSYRLLPVLNDVDEEKDLDALKFLDQ